MFPLRLKYQWTLQTNVHRIHTLVLTGGVANVPNSGCSDDSDEEDATPAERVGCLEDEDVLEEERVQLGQL